MSGLATPETGGVGVGVGVGVTVEAPSATGITPAGSGVAGGRGVAGFRGAYDSPCRLSVHATEPSHVASPEHRSGGGRVSDSDVRSYTVRLELVDEPGELLRALEPIADNGGNLLSIFHERGNITPRGHIPVEVDLEATPERFETIVAALRDNGVNVVQAGSEEYAEELVFLLIGHLVDTDLSDTLSRIENCGSASIDDVALSAPDGTDELSSARIRMDTHAGAVDEALSRVRQVADEKGLHVVEPLAGGGEA